MMDKLFTIFVTIGRKRLKKCKSSNIFLNDDANSEYWTKLPPKRELEKRIHNLFIEAKDSAQERFKLFKPARWNTWMALNETAI